MNNFTIITIEITINRRITKMGMFKNLFKPELSI